MKKTIAILIFTCLACGLFAQDNNPVTAHESPTVIIDKQIEAYNARDVEAFVATYTEDVELCNLDGTLISKGHEQLRERYGAMFDRTPNLNCEIVNRIVINNKVIDQERVTSNERIINAVAIYEVTGGKISRVTFVR